MGAVFCADNVYNVRTYPDHTVSATEEPGGREATRVADGRRSSVSSWTMTTANTEGSVTALFDRLRGFDFLALDRGHNLEGVQIILEATHDGGSTWDTVWDRTLPSVMAGGDIDDELGVVTSEGAYLTRFPFETGDGVRVRIPAMGAGLRPVIVGLWVGQSWSVEHLERPATLHGGTVVVQTMETAVGWRGTSTPSLRRRSPTVLKFDGWMKADEAERHLHDYAALRPMWAVLDKRRAERGYLTRAVEQVVELTVKADWGYPQIGLELEEHEHLVGSAA